MVFVEKYPKIYKKRPKIHILLRFCKNSARLKSGKKYLEERI